MDCCVPWPARSSWPSCHPRDFHGSGPLHLMGLPSEPPFPYNVPLGGCRWLLGLVPAACPLFLCSFKCPHPTPTPRDGSRRLNVGLSRHTWSSPESPRLLGRGTAQEGGAYQEPLIHERTQSHLLGISVLGTPSPSSRWPGKIWRFPGRFLPTPSPPSTPLLCLGEGVWTVSSTFGIQVVIKIIIIIKKI